MDFSFSFSRGVITDWPYDIPELWNNIVDKDIFKIEKMRRIWDQESKKYLWQYTNNFLVTMRGNTLKDRIMICDNLHIGLRIRPYVAPVIQCYNCFKFGHVKDQCRNKTKSIICGDNLHGECHKPLVCCNCGGDHRPTKKSCPIMPKNKEIKIIMAYNNILFQEAIRLVIDSCTAQKPGIYDRYTNPSRWPNINQNNKDRETEIKLFEKPINEQTYLRAWSSIARDSKVKETVTESRKSDYVRKEHSNMRNRENREVLSPEEIRSNIRRVRDKKEGNRRRQD